MIISVHEKLLPIRKECGEMALEMLRMGIRECFKGGEE